MDTSKIIKGVVSNGRYTVTAPIVKEDYGLQLQIEGIDLPSSYQVDFSNSENSGTSVTMVGSSNKVLIPREFIETGKDIFAFLYVVGSNYGRTVYKFRIPNKLRPDRTNIAPTPEEQSVIDQAISALNEAVEQTAQDVISADASAQSAQGYASQAETAKSDAQTYANNAQASATSASQSAQASANSATASAQSASEAQTASTNAETYALNSGNKAVESAQSASASANSASQAQGYAQSASASAQSASGYASQADISANTASNKASEASTLAQTASNKASEASQSASQALTYKTDAESAKTASQTAQGLAESARDSAISAKTDAESARDDAVQAKEDAESAVASISGALADKADVITDTASGAIASFSDGADDLPLKSLVVDINPVQDLHGYDSPWVAGGGKNLFDDSQPLLAGILNADGTSSGISSANNKHTYKIPIKAGATYTYSVSVTRTSNMVGCVYDENNAVIDNFMLARNTTTISFTAPENAVSVSLSIYNVAGQLVQFEEGSTATEWSPYENICPISGWTEVSVNHSDADMTNPTTLTIQLGQTVYGGKLDVVSGVLTVDMAMVDLGTQSYGYAPSIAMFNISSLSGLVKPVPGNNVKGNLVCSVYKTVARDQITASDFALAVNQNTGTVNLKDGRYSTTPELKSNLSGQKLVYELANPIEIQLSANQINSLLGVNNIWADSGDTEVEYRADTKLYINKKIAEAISALS